MTMVELRSAYTNTAVRRNVSVFRHFLKGVDVLLNLNRDFNFIRVSGEIDHQFEMIIIKISFDQERVDQRLLVFRRR